MGTKLQTRGRKTAEVIGRRETFKTSGALSAVASPLWGSGRLRGEDEERYMKDRTHMVYVVYSYATPIAWVTDCGAVYKVKQKFSVTTTKHQNNLYLLKGADHD